jgi:hypothetical protein
MTTILKALRRRAALRRILPGVTMGANRFSTAKDSNDVRDQRTRAVVGSRRLLERLTAEHGEEGRPDTFIQSPQKSARSRTC